MEKEARASKDQFATGISYRSLSPDLGSALGKSTQGTVRLIEERSGMPSSNLR
jgi:hypothetical protein